MRKAVKKRRSVRRCAKPKDRPTTKAAREAVKAENAEKAPDVPPIVMCNEKELAFIDHYTGDARFNGSLAIRLAGIHDNPDVAKVYASEWLNRAHVLAEIERRRDERKKQIEFVTSRLLEEQLSVALARISDVVDWDGRDAVLMPPGALDEATLAAIAEVSIIPGKWGDRMTVRMHPKLEAIAALQKQFEDPAALRRRGIAGGSDDEGGVTIYVDGGPTGLEVSIKGAST